MKRNVSTYFICLSLILQVSCVTNEGKPLQNTVKLMKKGHGDLYKNGALKVPYTEVKLIPPGPKTSELAASLIGVNARDSFVLALDNALSSTKLVKAGTLKTWKVTKKIHTVTGEVASNINEAVSGETVYMIDQSINLPSRAWTESLELTGELNRELRDIQKRLDFVSSKFGEEAKKELLSQSKQTFYDWNRYLKYLSRDIQNGAKDFDKTTVENSRKRFKDWWNEGRQSRKSIIKNAKELDRSFGKSGDELIRTSKIVAHRSDQAISETGDSIYSISSYVGEDVSDDLIRAARDFNGWTQKKSIQSFKDSAQYIKGYLSLPKKLKDISVDQTKTLDSFSKAYQLSSDTRKSLNKKLSLVWNEYSQSAGEDISETYQKMKSEVTENSDSIGYTLGVIKSLSWLTKLIVWDLMIKPSGYATVQGIGYLTVNGIIFPSMLLVTEGIATSYVATKLTLNVGEGIYEIVSPTIKAGVAASLAAVQFTGGKILSGGLLAPAKPIEYGLKLTGKTSELALKSLGKISNLGLQSTGTIFGVGMKGAGKIIRVPSYAVAPLSDGVIKTGAVLQSIGSEVGAKVVHGAGHLGSHLVRWPGYGAASIVAGSGIATGHMIELGSKGIGKTTGGIVRYLGIPTVSLGVPTTFTAAGVATGTVGSAIGAVGYTTGKIASAGTLVFGNSLAATTAIVGTTASVVAAATVSAYEIGKAITVPSAYTLGSGLVMSYGMMTHLGSQALLAVSDAAYLVLSLEGPRWVVYAISGKLNKGNNLKPGTVLDLEKMQSDGEEIKVVPTNSKTIERILKTI